MTKDKPVTAPQINKIETPITLKREWQDEQHKNDKGNES